MAVDGPPLRLNIAEIELSFLSGKCLSGRIPDKETLQKEIRAGKENRNNLNCYIDWQFTIKDARINLKLLHPKLKP